MCQQTSGGGDECSGKYHEQQGSGGQVSASVAVVFPAAVDGLVPVLELRFACGRRASEVSEGL